tara:strand:+ start:167 stop:856 length:690 start_codon:yes stop_codon:yes gene_type:complete
MNYTEIDGVMNDKVQWILRDIEAFSFFDKQLGREIFELFITFFDKKIIESYHVQESIVGEDGQPELKDLYSDKQIALFFEFRTALYRVQKQLEPLDAKPEKKQEMLTGSDLLSKVKELGDVSKSDLVRACGYVSTKKNGSERLNFTAFYEALLEAKGKVLGEEKKWTNQKDTSKYFNISERTLLTLRSNGFLTEGKCWVRKIPTNPNSHVLYDIFACCQAFNNYEIKKQ